MANHCYLGIDLGAESGRVVAATFDGERVELDVQHRFPNRPVTIGGSRRWNVLSLWSEIQHGLSEAAANYGDQIRSVGVDTWGVDYVLMSRDGEILGQPYQYRDSRTEGVFGDMFQRVPRKDIFAATGVQFLEINSLPQLMAMRRDHPKVLDFAERFLMMPDFFHWCLCGSQVVEFTNATTSQCFHTTTGTWAYDMLKQLDLPTEMFPDVVLPGTALGRLREDVANATGLGRIEVVAPPTHDTASAVVAVPTIHTGQANWAYISSGTWSLMGVELPNAVTTEQALAWNVTNEGGVDQTYRLLKNIMGLWLVQRCRASFEQNGKSYDYAELVNLAAETEPFRSLIDPDDAAFLNPDDMPTAIREWCRSHNEPEPSSEGELIRCALESLALKYRLVLERLEQLTGTPIEVIHIVGGGSQNGTLNQFTANACGRPVIAGPVEATALGNVLIQARTNGQLSSLAEIRQVVYASSDLVQFDPSDSAAWNAAYDRFLGLFN